MQPTKVFSASFSPTAQLADQDVFGDDLTHVLCIIMQALGV
jgi:hypothetical protein